MPTLAVRNHNPGDLRFAGQPGAVPGAGGFAAFPDQATGTAALENDLQAKVTGNTKTGLKPTSTLAQFAAIYAPASDGNDPTTYAENLAKQLGVTTDTPLAALQGRIHDFASAVAHNEDSGSSLGQAPTGNYASQQISPLTHAQLISNINAMEQQGAKPQEIQSYLDSLKGSPQQSAPQSQGVTSQPSSGVTADALSGSGGGVTADTLSGSTGNPFQQYSSAQLPPPAGSDPSGGFFSGLQEDLSGTNPNSIGTQLANTAKGVGNFLFPAVGDVYNDVTGKNSKTALQQAGDVGSTALSVASLIPGLDVIAAPAKEAELAAEGANVASKAAPGLLSQVGKNAAIGGAYGVTNAVGNGATDPNEIAKQGLIGAGTGGVVGGAGSLVQKVADTLPQRLVQGVLKNSNPDVAQYALTKPLGSPAKMLADSTKSLSDIGSQLGAALTHSNVADVVVPSDQIVPKILEQFPNAELTPEALQNEINKIAPLQKRLTSKLFSGEGLSIDELHTLNSAIGKNTFKTAFDDPTVKAGKDIGNAFYQASKQIITTAAPDTAPLFDQYSKEIALNTALSKVAKRGVKAQALTLKDIMSLMGGYAALGPMGALGAVGLERAARSPGVNMQAAGLLNKLAGQGVNKLAAPAAIGATGLLNQAVGSMSN